MRAPTPTLMQQCDGEDTSEKRTKAYVALFAAAAAAAVNVGVLVLVSEYF